MCVGNSTQHYFYTVLNRVESKVVYLNSPSLTVSSIFSILYSMPLCHISWYLLCYCHGYCSSNLLTVCFLLFIALLHKAHHYFVPLLLQVLNFIFIHSSLSPVFYFPPSSIKINPSRGVSRIKLPYTF